MSMSFLLVEGETKSIEVDTAHYRFQAVSLFQKQPKAGWKQHNPTTCSSSSLRPRTSHPTCQGTELISASKGCHTMWMVNSAGNLDILCGMTSYLLVFTSRDELHVGVFKTSNLSGDQGLERVLNGLATEYDQCSYFH